ncbi:truncated transposase [Streptococcus pyogenes]|nr:truncated transposase [Streptococcus pyogenes]
MLHKEKPDYNRNQYGFYTLDQLVPDEHFLRQVEAVIDFDFIYDLVEDTYSSDNGRPSLDPVMLVKIPLIQCFYGIRSMRQTIKDIEVNTAYRWFLGLTLDDKVPHFTTYNRKFINREVEKQAKFMSEQLEIEINRDREKHGKKPLGPAKELEPVAKKIFTTDPESGWFHRS